MIIVFDTNVLVSAFAFRGLCYEIFSASFDRFTLATSDFILDEFKKTLTTKFHMPQKRVVEFVHFIKQHALVIVPSNAHFKSLTDPNDDLVLGTAIAASADYLITGDKAILMIKKVDNTLILSPRDFLIKKII